MDLQLKIPFNISPGCIPRYCRYMKIIEELCPGGLVFPIGSKADCKVCAKTCQGCVEMAINLGYSEFEDLKHLIIRPEILNNKYKRQYINYLKQ